MASRVGEICGDESLKLLIFYSLFILNWSLE